MQIDNYLNSAIGLTFDLDWAHDAITADTIELLIRANVKATFFVTHKTSVFDGLSQDFEMGIHPNFDGGSDFTTNTPIKWHGACGPRGKVCRVCPGRSR